MRIYFGYHYNLRVLNLREFFKILNVEQIDDMSMYFQYTYQSTNKDTLPPDPALDEVHVDVKDAITKISQNPNPILAIKENLERQATFMPTKTYDIKDLIEAAIYEYVSGYGIPKYLVRLGPREWFIASDQDFIIVRNAIGYAGLCTFPEIFKVYCLNKWNASVSIMFH